jgi:hypothetical protein
MSRDDIIDENDDVNDSSFLLCHTNSVNAMASRDVNEEIFLNGSHVIND